MSEFEITNHMRRDEIELAIKKLKIDRQDFAEVSKTKWNGIVRQTIQPFVKVNHYKNNDCLHWAWERFKEPFVSTVFDDFAYRYLAKIISDEYVWLIVEDAFDKMWVYEAKTNLIPIVLDETPYFEYYIVSKKYDWLFCENHHSCFFAVGEKGIELLNRFKRDLLT